MGVRLTSFVLALLAIAFQGNWRQLRADEDRNPDSQASESSKLAPRKFTSIKKDADAFGKRARLAKTDSERVNASIDCILLYCEMRTDPRFLKSPSLQGLSKVIRSRLNKICKDLQREKIKAQRSNKKTGAGKSDSHSELQHDEDWYSLAEKEALTNSLALSNRLNGGLEGVFERSSGYYGGSAMDDNADELINLIQNVIHPDSWEVNGGTGRIQYYRPSMALVVTATTTVHEDLSSLLMVLRSLM